MTAPIAATLIPGDGIGPEIVDASLTVLDALGAPFEWDRQIAGLAGVQAAGDPLPEATLASIRRTRVSPVAASTPTSTKCAPKVDC